MATPYSLKFARINADADGDNTIVAAVAGKRLRVFGYALGSSSGAECDIKSGASTILAEFTLAANGQVSYAGGDASPAFETSVGEAVVINTTAAQDVNGHLVYAEV